VTPTPSRTPAGRDALTMRDNGSVLIPEAPEDWDAWV
jgi:hypothetical protein